MLLCAVSAVTTGLACDNAKEVRGDTSGRGHFSLAVARPSLAYVHVSAISIHKSVLPRKLVR